MKIYVNLFQAPTCGNYILPTTHYPLPTTISSLKQQQPHLKRLVHVIITPAIMITIAVIDKMEGISLKMK